MPINKIARFPYILILIFNMFMGLAHKYFYEQNDPYTLSQCYVCSPPPPHCIKGPLLCTRAQTYVQQIYNYKGQSYVKYIKSTLII